MPEDEFAEIAEEVVQTTTAPRKAKKAEKKEEKSRKKPKGSKPPKERKPKATKREKLIKNVLKNAKVQSIPTVDELFSKRSGDKMKIKKIAVFLSNKPGDEILDELAEQLSIPNTVNLSTEVDLKQVKKVGIQILEAGKVWMSIEVAKLKDGSKNHECWSGRHRLAFLALLYGPDAEIPVEICSMTTQEARDAVVYANSSRKVLGLEQAEHCAMKATEGAPMEDIERDELYAKMARAKKGAVDFGLITLMDLKVKGLKLKFDISKSASRAEGNCLTTVKNIRGFINTAMEEWTKTTTRKEYDETLSEAVAYLNAIVEALKTLEGFDPTQQLAAKPLSALGKLFNKFGASSAKPHEYGEMIAEILIGLGQIGRHKAGETLKQLVQKLKEATTKE